MNPLEAIQKYLAEVKAVREKATPGPWFIVGSEIRHDLDPYATDNISDCTIGVCEVYRLSAELDDKAPTRKFIAQSPVTQEKLERALAIAVEALRGLRQPGHAAELRMDKIMADIARAIGEEK